MIVVAVILYATLFPDPAGVDDLPLIPHIDKLIHAIMFGGLAGALAFDYSRSHNIPKPSPRTMAAFAIASTLVGGGIELLQDAMQLGRGADWFDFLADAVGALVAYFAAPPAIARCLKSSTSEGSIILLRIAYTVSPAGECISSFWQILRR